MNMEKPRILVIGAGVNGSIVASGLFAGGLDVTVLARGKRFEDVCAEGIVIEDPFSLRRRVTRVPAINRLDADDLYDFILVVIRKNQVSSLLPLLAQNHSTNIVFMGNNLSGPSEIVQMLGKERVMLGAVFGAGRREGSLIRAMIIKSVAVPFGEINGTITPRLKQLAAILRQAGFKVNLSAAIVDFQMTHAMGVALIGMLALKHGGDVRSLARDRDDLLLFVAARKEGHRVLRALGHRIIPPFEAVEAAIPGFIQVAGFRALLKSKFGEVGLAWHLSQAPDEIKQLALELQELVDRAGIPTPAIRKVMG